MAVIAKGKDEVLKFLEDFTRERTGTEGEYRLIEDDAGTLCIFIAGRVFVGTDTMVDGGNNLTIRNAMVVDQE